MNIAIIIYIRKVRAHHSTKTDSTYNDVTARLVSYPFTYMLVWFPTVIIGAVVASRLDHGFPPTGWLYLIALFRPIQGFFNCFIYGWNERLADKYASCLGIKRAPKFDALASTSGGSGGAAPGVAGTSSTNNNNNTTSLVPLQSVSSSSSLISDSASRSRTASEADISFEHGNSNNV
eukprot:TRINITY_DN392_c0_g1_i1.p2 TRINITY_DN392_c0_g1~~TRINITY_DN392_c0_g1_i1.p2  ORF type:complete len:177 (-),score=38.85 TRINITY_DN392_c0_g1_i1:101-631(-)